MVTFDTIQVADTNKPTKADTNVTFSIIRVESKHGPQRTPQRSSGQVQDPANLDLYPQGRGTVHKIQITMTFVIASILSTSTEYIYDKSTRTWM